MLGGVWGDRAEGAYGGLLESPSPRRGAGDVETDRMCLADAPDAFRQPNWPGW